MDDVFLDIRAAANDKSISWCNYTESHGEIWKLRDSPKFIFGNFTSEMAKYFYEDICAPSCGLYFIENANIFGDTVVEISGIYAEIPQNGVHRKTIENLIPKYKAENKRSIIRNPVVVLCGPAHQIYGHWIIDFLPRLYVVSKYFSNWQNMTYLIPSSIEPFAVEWLKLLGINPKNIISDSKNDRIYHLKSAIIPTAIRGNGRASPLLKSARSFILEYAGQQNTSSTEKIFVSRRHFNNPTRLVEGIDEIEGLFSSFGFRIVQPEKFPIKEQISIFFGAGYVSGEYGSGLHNTIFSKPGTRVIGLRGNQGHPGFLQSGIGEALEQPTGYVIGTTETAQAGQVTRFDLSDIRRCLEIICRDIDW